MSYVRFFDDFDGAPLTNVWSDTVQSGFATDKRYVVQTNPRVIARSLLMTTDPGDLVVDPTCGSGTTAFVAEQFGRRWITIDTSRSLWPSPGKGFCHPCIRSTSYETRYGE